MRRRRMGTAVAWPFQQPQIYAVRLGCPSGMPRLQRWYSRLGDDVAAVDDAGGGGDPVSITDIGGGGDGGGLSDIGGGGTDSASGIITFADGSSYDSNTGQSLDAAGNPISPTDLGTTSSVSPDGTMTLADGTTISPDGTTTDPNGNIFLPDGSQFLPDGTFIDAQGNVHPPNSVTLDPSSPSIVSTPPFVPPSGGSGGGGKPSPGSGGGSPPSPPSSGSPRGGGGGGSSASLPQQRLPQRQRLPQSPQGTAALVNAFSRAIGAVVSARAGMTPQQFAAQNPQLTPQQASAAYAELFGGVGAQGSTSSSFFTWLRNYGPWLAGGAAALFILPRLLPAATGRR